MDCCLCDSQITVEPLSGWDKGHNAEPLGAGRCCDNCNNNVVMERIRRLHKTKQREITHATN